VGSKTLLTEAEWATAIDPQLMLDHLHSGTDLSPRKRRLFACGCCRLVWRRLKNPDCQRVVETAELHADGLATVQALAAAVRGVDFWSRNSLEADAAIACAWTEPHWQDALREVMVLCGLTFGIEAALLHDLVGNPFRPVTVDPTWLAWNGGFVSRLAQAIYDEHRFKEMLILGDALEDAGCTDEAILTHCRGLGPHARGCWVVDLILAKQ
jgi:hypothetical protein